MYTETDEQVRTRWARWKMGGYGWFPRTADEEEQVELLANIKPLKVDFTLCDPRTPAERDLDEWQAETATTRESDYPR